MAGAVAGHRLAGREGGEAARKDTSKRGSLVVGLVGGSIRGQGGLKVRSGLSDLSDQWSFLDVALLLRAGETIVGSECVLCCGLGYSEDQNSVVLVGQGFKGITKCL